MRQLAPGWSPKRLSNGLTPARVAAVCGALVLLYGLLSIHGFSISYWRFLDQSPQQEVLLGTAQGARGDDWSVWLPYAIAQAVHDPPGALVNENVGFGQNMSLIHPAPIRDPLVFYRPYTWGFFVSPDFGMGWCWGLYVFGFIAAFHLLFTLIADGRSGLALVASVALLFSPFFQFWGLTAAFVSATAAFCVAAAHRLLFGGGPIPRWLYGVLLGWSAGAFGLWLYPPYQITIGWFALFTLAGLTLRSLKRGERIRRDASLAAGALAALLVAGFAALRFLQIASEEIALTGATLYPGQRLASGGATPFWRIFSDNVFPHIFLPASPSVGENICESASFTLFFPVLLFALLHPSNRRALRADPLFATVLAFLALLLAWNVLGLPEGIAQASLLSRVPEKRTPLGFGAADMVLILGLLCSRETSALALRSRVRWGLLFAAIFAAQLALLLWIARRDPQLLAQGPLLQVATLMGGELVIAFLLLKKRAAALVAFAALNLLSTAWFNPVVQGGSRYVFDNPVSSRIRELDAAHGGGSSWLVFNDLALGQLPPMLGARSLSAMQYYPQAEFWSRLDPERRQADAYNRYAHVVFQAMTRPAPLRITAPQLDVVGVAVHPDDPKLLALPFDYVIYSGTPPASLARSPNYRPLFREGSIHFFERLRS
jgi:hypothetical protein